MAAEQRHTTLENIIERLNDMMPEIQSFGVLQIGVFGSVRRGEAHPDSDLDILVALQPYTFSAWMRLWDYLEDALGREIDLVPLDDLREELRQNILAEVVYAEGLSERQCAVK